MTKKSDRKHGSSENVPHSKPGSIDQHLEDSFPTSDAPSFSPGVDAVDVKKSGTIASGPTAIDMDAVEDAARKVKSGHAKDPKTY